MKPDPGASYQPLLEVTRAGLTESVHFGALAVVDSRGRLVAAQGDASLVAFPRSSLKPLQAVPFIQAGGQEAFGLSQAETALICASHAGTDVHVENLRRFHDKVGLEEQDLGCGIHLPYHQATAQEMARRGEETSPFRHNCSGKHTGMLAYARLGGWPLETYLEPDHPVQQ
ncbi:MAG: asparaginase, partial [Anaerolineales bacterium]|nr:asparaginase [Anaerolineales bacterium]